MPLLDSDFPKALIGQIRKGVAKVTIEPGQCVAIHFRDESIVSFSTSREGGQSEAFTLFTMAGVYEE